VLVFGLATLLLMVVIVTAYSSIIAIQDFERALLIMSSPTPAICSTTCGITTEFARRSYRYSSWTIARTRKRGVKTSLRSLADQSEQVREQPKHMMEQYKV
jgi:hypothetical protein